MGRYLDAVLARDPMLLWRPDRVAYRPNSEVILDRSGDGYDALAYTNGLQELRTEPGPSGIEGRAFRMQASLFQALYEADAGGAAAAIFKADTDRTFSVWVYRDTGDAMMLYCGGNGSDQFGFYLFLGGTGSSSGLRDVSYGPRGNAGTVNNFVNALPVGGGVGAWMRITIAHNPRQAVSGNASLYVNGALVSSPANFSSWVQGGAGTQNNNVRLGVWNYGPGGILLWPTNGLLADFEVLGRLTTAAEEAELYALGVAPGPTTIAITREIPPDLDRLALSVRTPDGVLHRWADDEPEAERIPEDLTLSDSIPGGDAELDCRLLRDMRRRRGRDLDNFNEVRAYGPGNETIWSGYLTRSPDSAYEVSPGATGDVGRLKDDPSYRAIPVDRDPANWREATRRRQIKMLNNGASGAGTYERYSGAGEVARDPAGELALILGLPEAHNVTSGTEIFRDVAEAWYDARGIPIGKISADFDTFNSQDATKKMANANWLNGWGLWTDDLATTGDVTTRLGGGPGSASLTATDANRLWAQLRLTFNADLGAPGGADRRAFYKRLALYGREIARTVNPEGGPECVRGRDVLAHILAFAGIPTDDESYGPDDFLIPHLVWLEPTTAEQAILDTNRFYRHLWGIRAGRWRWHPAATYGRLWRVRRDEGADVESNGPDAELDYNGVLVRYTDANTQTEAIVGPPSTGLKGPSALATTALFDADEELPINRWGRRRYAIIEAGLTSEPGAIRLGQYFLAGLRDRRASGSLQIENGQIRDSSGVRYPAWAARAGDRIQVEDEPGATERLIIERQFSYAGRTASLTLDSAPDRLESLLERLQVVLVGVTD